MFLLTNLSVWSLITKETRSIPMCWFFERSLSSILDLNEIIQVTTTLEMDQVETIFENAAEEGGKLTK